MLRVNYGLQPFGSDAESDQIREKTRHLMETAKKTGAIVYIISDECGYIHYVAVSSSIELEIKLNRERDFQSMAMMEELSPIKVRGIYSQAQQFQRIHSIAEKLNQDANTTQCINCGRSTIAYSGMTFCTFCGEKFGSEYVKFCRKCKDNIVYSGNYKHCPECGDTLLEHPEICMNPLEFEAEDLLRGVEIKSEYMDYKTIIPQAQQENRI